MIQKFILGTKGMSSQVFTDKGIRVPTTKVHTPSCFVIGVRTMDKDGYWAVQLGFHETKKINKPQQEQLKKAGIKTPLRFFREVRLNTPEQTLEISVIEGKKQGIKIGDMELHVGDSIQADKFFVQGDLVEVTGTSKGKGFQGVVRRHGFHGGPRTHGQSDRERAPGSIGTGTTPGRTLKGKKMAGRMGGDTITVKNLEVLEVTNDGVIIKGLVPGSAEGLLLLRSANALPMPAVEEDKIEAVVDEVVQEEPKEEAVKVESDKDTKEAEEVAKEEIEAEAPSTEVPGEVETKEPVEETK